MWSRSSPALQKEVANHGRKFKVDPVNSTQTDAAAWATRYNTSPVLHSAGVPLGGSELATDFMNYSTPNVPGFPTFVFLSPVLKILRVPVGAASPSESGLLITSTEISKIIYDDVKTNPLNATLELKTLMNSWNPEDSYKRLWNTQLDYVITSPQPSDKSYAISSLKLHNTQIGEGYFRAGFNSDQQKLLLTKSYAILKMLSAWS